jgi:hypothetical protein
MRRSISLAAVFALLVLGMLGCSEETPSITQSGAPEVTLPVAQYVVTPCGDPLEPIFYAGQFIDVGRVSVYNDEENLYIEMTTTGAWVMTESHVAVAPTLAGIPQTGSGNPKVGQFALSAVHNPPVSSYVYTVSVTGYDPDQPLYIAVHAIVKRIEGGHVVQQETAWADGEDFPGANWATYIMYDVQECTPPPEPTYGACCVGTDCAITTEAECLASGGTYLGDDTVCDENPCEVPPTPTGACCVGVDCVITTEAECLSVDGSYHGDYSSCGPDACLGACCLPGGDCAFLTAADCASNGGAYHGDGTTCGQYTCGE